MISHVVTNEPTASHEWRFLGHGKRPVHPTHSFGWFSSMKARLISVRQEAPMPAGRFACASRAVVLISSALILSGCSTTSGPSLDDAIAFTSGALNVVSAVGDVASGSPGSPPAAPSAPSVSPRMTGSGQVSSAAGYSQLGAFKDCAETYRAAGRPDLERTCATRATNMGSLR